MNNRIKRRNNHYKYEFTPFVNKPSNKKPLDYRKKNNDDVSYITEKYGVTRHCAIRCLQRVFDNHEYVNNAGIIKIAKFIKNSIDFNLDIAIDGSYPFLDKYNIHVLNHKLITITHKEI